MIQPYLLLNVKKAKKMIQVLSSVGDQSETIEQVYMYKYLGVLVLLNFMWVEGIGLQVCEYSM